MVFQTTVFHNNEFQICLMKINLFLFYLLLINFRGRKLYNLTMYFFFTFEHKFFKGVKIFLVLFLLEKYQDHDDIVVKTF